MPISEHKNFAISTLATPPSSTDGTSLVVASGHGALFPEAPFNVTVWPTSVQPTSSNAEIMRVTNKATDTFTVTRAQEGTSGRTHLANAQIAATITARTLTDVEYGAHGIINVMDPLYGAVGDGVTDDTAAFEAAATAAGSGVVMASSPDASFLLSSVPDMGASTLVLSAPSALSGTGAADLQAIHAMPYVSGFLGGAASVSDLRDRKIRAVGCVIRNSGSGWAFISNDNHYPAGFDAIEVNVDGDIVLTYKDEATRVISLVVGVDETLGLGELFVGPSVGLSTVIIKMYKPLHFWVDGTTVYAHDWWGTDITADATDPNELVITHPTVSDANDSPVVVPIRGATSPTPIIACNAALTSIDVEAYGPLAGIVEYDGADFTWTGEALTAPTFSWDGGTGTLTIIHAAAPNLYGAQVTQRGSGSHRPVVQSTNATNTLIRWMNTSDAVVTTPDTSMKAYFYRDMTVQTPWDTGFRVGVSRGPAKLNANNVVSSGGNLWIVGLLDMGPEDA